jgi:hypothetical protein
VYLWTHHLPGALHGLAAGARRSGAAQVRIERREHGEENLRHEDNQNRAHDAEGLQQDPGQGDRQWFQTDGHQLEDAIHPSAEFVGNEAELVAGLNHQEDGHDRRTHDVRRKEGGEIGRQGLGVNAGKKVGQEPG